MKRYLVYTYILLLFACLTGCSKKDDSLVFGETPGQRALAELKKDQSILISAPYGWKAVLFPGTFTGTGFFFKFDDQKQVQSYPDPSVTLISPKSGIAGTSSYQLKSLQRPSLIFDTYSALHVLSDPVNGNRGQGFSSDFEFAFVSASPDTIRFEGNFNQSPMILIKATQAEYTAYQNNGLKAISLALDNFATATKGKKILLTIDATHAPECSIVTDKGGDRTFTLTYTDSKGIQQVQTTNWGPTVNSIFFQNTIVYNGIVINEVFYDNAKLSLYIQWQGKRYDLVVAP